MNLTYNYIYKIISKRYRTPSYILIFSNRKNNIEVNFNDIETLYDTLIKIKKSIVKDVIEYIGDDFEDNICIKKNNKNYKFTITKKYHTIKDDYIKYIDFNIKYIDLEYILNDIELEL